MESRPGVDAGPADAAIGRAVHHVLANGETATAFVHCCHVNTATALQVACDLDVTDEAGVELHSRPGGAVVGVNDIQCTAPDGEIVVGNVHPPPEWADRVVIDPHALAVIAGAAVGTRTRGPGDTVSGCPEPDALPAAACRQIAGEPHPEASVVDDNRIAVVSAVAGAERTRVKPGEAGSVVGRIRQALKTAGRPWRGIVIDDPGVVRAAPLHAFRFGDARVTVRFGDDNINVGASDERRLRQQRLDQFGQGAARSVLGSGR